jgi:ABC-2 type transport system permease protein
MKNMKDIKGFFKKKKLTYHLNAMILTLIIIGIMVLVNYIVFIHDIRFDCTANRIYSLSEQSKQFLTNFVNDIKVLGFFKNNTDTTMIRQLLKSYEDFSDNIKVSFVDPEKEPRMANQYGVDSYGVIVFIGPERKKKLNINSLYTYSNITGKSIFKGEQEFTRAIIDVTKENTSTICFTKGHEEYSLEKELKKFKDALEGEGYKLSSNNLVQSGISDETDLIVIAGPKRDFHYSEISLIKKFIDRGGNIFFFIEPPINLKANSLKNINAFLSDTLAVNIGERIVIDDKQSYYFDPYSPIANMKSHPITDKLIEEEMSIVLPLSRNLSKNYDYKGLANAKQLLNSSKHSWGESDFMAEKIYKDADDLEGPLCLGFSVTKPISKSKNSSGEEASDEMRAVILGSTAIITDKVFNIQANGDFIINCVNWLTNQEEKINIKPKEIDAESINLTPSVGKAIFYGTVVILPIFIFIIGSFVWFRRKYL